MNDLQVFKEANVYENFYILCEEVPHTKEGEDYYREVIASSDGNCADRIHVKGHTMYIFRYIGNSRSESDRTRWEGLGKHGFDLWLTYSNAPDIYHQIYTESESDKKRDRDYEEDSVDSDSEESDNGSWLVADSDEEEEPEFFSQPPAKRARRSNVPRQGDIDAHKFICELYPDDPKIKADSEQILSRHQ